MGEEDMPDVASTTLTDVGVSKLSRLSGTVVRFLEPHLGALVWQAARLVSKGKYRGACAGWGHNRQKIKTLVSSSVRLHNLF